jgi:hypothetical protein
MSSYRANINNNQETDGAFVDVEEPLEEDDEEDVEMDYAEEEYDSEESHDDDEANAMDVVSAGDVDIHDDDDTDPDDEEILAGGENEHDDDDDEGSGDEDEDSVSDHQDVTQGDLGDDMWQVCGRSIFIAAIDAQKELDLPRDEGGMLLGQDEDDDDDDDDEGVDGENHYHK